MQRQGGGAWSQGPDARPPQPSPAQLGLTCCLPWVSGCSGCGAASPWQPADSVTTVLSIF
ncbi:unnamed protein product [Nyctereutes procyonoides]|uniref:(raccoon dog) hypothetical protein n=1 Tax=Nyctereutes procyonoides TaxID=34880 RepID=A0A811ZMG2_NYCPR|nr:unnamed protein product [Nyctereutes procyonoides]